MQPKTLGDLRYRSKSFADFAAAARHNRHWVLEGATNQILANLLPEGLPGDVEDMLKDQGKFFIVWLEASILSSALGKSVRSSAPAKKLVQLAQRVPTIEKALKAIARSGAYGPLQRLYLVAEANHLSVHSPLRIVNSSLTPYQAKSQCEWRGTFAEFRTGTILSGPADPNGHFAVYLPNERHHLRGNFVVTRITCEFQ